MPSNCIWVDTETKYKLDGEGRQHHYLWFGWACYQRREKGKEWSKPEWLRFETIAEFWEWLNSKCRKKTRLYLFAHNGAFDLPVLHAFTEVPKLGFKLKSAVADAPPLILTWRGDKRTIKFIDTLNIWRQPLEQIGKMIGHKKLRMPDPDAPQADWNAYGKQDVEVIRQAVLAWLDFLVENDLGYFSPTLASQAFNTYRHRFMKTPIFIDAKDNALEISRAAYVGGRTECFKLGHHRGEFYYIDVNSMYPAVMRANLYPSRLVSVYGRPDTSELTKWAAMFTMVGEVDIKTTLPIYPVIMAGKLVFPIGEFTATLAHPELLCAIERGHAQKVHRVACYEKAELFTEFIDEIYAMRLKAKADGNAVQSWMFKILMNSLYGKFGQRGRRFETIDECDPNEIDAWLEVDADTGDVRNLRKFGGIVQEWISEDESRHSFPAIAATVTSYARQLLWDAIETAGRENLYYCDTDSMVVNRAGFDRIQHLMDDSRLGYWKLEETFSELTIYGPKDYVFGSTARTKGVRANALWLSPNRIEQDRFVGLKGLLREKNLTGPIVHKIEKQLSREYTKANVYADGSVSPVIATVSSE